MNTTLRRSQLYRRHLEHGAQFEFEKATDSLVVAAYSNAGGEQRQATHLGLADLSTLPRAGFKGPGAPDWFRQQGVLASAPNHAQLQDDGSLVARLSHEELLVLSDLGLASVIADSLQKNWSMDTAERIWPLRRGDSHCWFAMTSELAAETLTQAAESLGITQSAVSQTIKQLEEQTATELVVRSSRPIKLTPSG